MRGGGIVTPSADGKPSERKTLSNRKTTPSLTATQTHQNKNILNEKRRNNYD
jgi:hypothetical protein